MDVADLEMPFGYVHLEGEAEEELRQVVVQVRGDLRPLVLPFLRHPVRQRPKHLLAHL